MSSSIWPVTPTNEHRLGKRGSSATGVTGMLKITATFGGSKIAKGRSPSTNTRLLGFHAPQEPFVASNLELHVPTRSDSTQAPGPAVAQGKP